MNNYTLIMTDGEMKKTFTSYNFNKILSKIYSYEELGVLDVVDKFHYELTGRNIKLYFEILISTEL